MKYICLIIIIITCTCLSAQEKTIVEHFDSIISNSNTFSNKRIIKIRELDTFKNELVNSQNTSQNTINALNDKLKEKDNQISKLTSEKENLNTELQNAKTSIDNISFIGLSTKKETYSILVWTLIFLLVIIIAIIIFRSRSIKIINSELRENLENINAEFDNYKQISIEKQQKLGRELLDVKKKLNPNNNK